MADQTDIFESFAINLGAFRYFGIICFRDIPGYFPQLGTTPDQNRNLKHHVGAVLDKIAPLGSE
jgi:hypothetical protein